MSIKKVVKQLLQKPLSGFVNYILKMFNLFIVYRIGNAIGDQLCMSAIVRLINEQYPFKIIVISSYPELFYNNPRIWKNIGIKYFSAISAKVLRNLNGQQVENFLFKNDSLTYEEYMRENDIKLHLTEVHSLHFKNKIDFNIISNEIYFSELEIEEYKKKFNIQNKYIIVQPNGKMEYTLNKQWGFDNYKKIINKCKKIQWIQVGVSGDLIMQGIDNFVGKTSLRELAFLIKNAVFVIADEGLLNHMASAVKTKSFVVYSGFSSIEIAKYDLTIPIVNKPQVNCAPCWITEKCPKKKKYCTEEISVNQVIQSIERAGYDEY